MSVYKLELPYSDHTLGNMLCNAMIFFGKVLVKKAVH